MQIKITLKFYFIPSRMDKINNTIDSSWWQVCGVKGILTRYVATMEINMVISQKTWNGFTSRPSYTTLGHISKECSSHVNYFSIQNTQKLETTYMSLNRKMDKEKVVHLHNGVLLSHWKIMSPWNSQVARQWWCITLISALRESEGGRSLWVQPGLEWVPGQPGLYRKTLSWAAPATQKNSQVVE